MAFLLLTACGGGPRVYVNFPEKTSPPPAAVGTAPAADAQPAAVQTAPAQPAANRPDAPAPATQIMPPEPVPPYWVLYSSWRSDHQDIVRRLDSPQFSVSALEPLFTRARDSLRDMEKRLDAGAVAVAEGFARRYDELQKDAIRDTNRGILRESAYRLGKEIERRFSAAVGQPAPPPQTR